MSQKKRKLHLPALPPSKRGQKRQYESEVLEDGTELANDTRSRRNREMARLQHENEKLQRERREFLDKIESLSLQLDSLTRNESSEVLWEHQVLKRELALHAEFISNFKSAVEEDQPESIEKAMRKDLYAQGADAAHAFLLGLISESSRWMKVQKPTGISIPLTDLEFRICFHREGDGGMFGVSMNDDDDDDDLGDEDDDDHREAKKRNERKRRGGPPRRLSLRLDTFFPDDPPFTSSSSSSSSATTTTTTTKPTKRPPVRHHKASAESMQQLFFRAFCNTADMQRLYGASSDISMSPVQEGDDANGAFDEDEDTRLLHFEMSPRLSRDSSSASPSEGHSTFFIANRRRQTMTISSLWPSPDQDIFGTCNAHVVAMTSTTLVPTSAANKGSSSGATGGDDDDDDELARRGSEAINIENKKRGFSGTVVKGAVTWYDDIARGVRLLVIFSVPEDYKILNKLQFGELVEEKMRSVRKKANDQESSSSERNQDASQSNSNNMTTTMTKRVQMTPKFANVLKSVAIEFAAMMSEGQNPQPGDVEANLKSSKTTTTSKKKKDEA